MRRGQQGFTLVEVLLAITLVAMILGMAYGGLRTSARAVDRGQDMIDRTNHLRIVHQFVRRQIAQLMPLQIPPDEAFDEEHLTYFEGDDELIHFAAPMPGYLSSGGPHEQRLYFESGPDGDQELLFEHKVLIHDEDWPEGEAREPVVLLSGIRRGRFQFLTLDDEGVPDEWVDEWDDPTVLPTMIRVEIEMARGSRLVWPTLEVRPLLDSGTMQRQLDRPFVLPTGRQNNG